MLLSLDPQILILLLPALVFSLCVHEFSHGIVAYINGDDTAYKEGRLTLNPMKHLDPTGTIMLLFIGFGYAKPVPVNPYKLKNPNIDIIKVAAAGPLSNLVLAFLGVFIMYFTYSIMPSLASQSFKLFFHIFIQINIFLALFNLLPFFPLDGGQIFGNIISKYNHELAQNLNTYGPKILLGLILFGIITGYSIIGIIIEPLYILIRTIFDTIVLFVLKIFI